MVKRKNGSKKGTISIVALRQLANRSAWREYVPGNEYRFRSFHYPLWIELGEMSYFADNFEIIDTSKPVQLRLFDVI